MKKFGLLIISLILAANISYATNHIIRFGGDFGFSYSPNTMQIYVGDTVTWMGDFETHPLASVMVPEGALNFSESTGDMFLYIVQVPGEYNYQCNSHFADGMTGSFSAMALNTGLAVLDNAKPMYVVQEQGQNILYSTVTNNNLIADNFTMSIYDVNGRMIVSTNINIGDTRYVLPALTTGIYVVRVWNDERPLLAAQIWQP